MIEKYIGENAIAENSPSAEDIFIALEMKRVYNKGKAIKITKLEGITEAPNSYYLPLKLTDDNVTYKPNNITSECESVIGQTFFNTRESAQGEALLDIMLSRNINKSLLVKHQNGVSTLFMYWQENCTIFVTTLLELSQYSYNMYCPDYIYYIKAAIKLSHIFYEECKAKQTAEEKEWLNSEEIDESIIYHL